MMEGLKKALYFPLASYFRFFARIRLTRWHPRIVVVTGSNGKTTLLHLLEAQIGEKAKFSHHANSSYGIPFDILGLERKTLRQSEWIDLIVKAPFLAFATPPKEKIYVVEADCDRPGEGKFLADFLRPEVVLWTSISRTHSMNFDGLVKSPQPPLNKGGVPQDGGFTSVEETIAYEYGYFLEYCRKFAVINGDVSWVVKQRNRAKGKVTVIIQEDSLQKYEVTREGTTFHINKQSYSFPALLPEEIFYAIEMCKQVVAYLDLPFDREFSHFEIPPGRGSVFSGIKDTSLIDSSYNANLASINAMLGMFAKFPAKKKWVVIGDMMELGEEEKEEHEKLADMLVGMNLERIVLVGKRVSNYTDPKLRGITGIKSIMSITSFENQRDVLEYLKKNIHGGEAILFKGSQSLLLEGVIAPLLKNKEDAGKLPRREAFWDEQRKKKGL